MALDSAQQGVRRLNEVELLPRTANQIQTLLSQGVQNDLQKLIEQSESPSKIGPYGRGTGPERLDTNESVLIFTELADQIFKAEKYNLKSLKAGTKGRDVLFWVS